MYTFDEYIYYNYETPPSMTMCGYCVHDALIGICYMVSWLNQYQIDDNDPLVGAEMTMGATCLYTWHVNVTPQVWMSWCCCNHQCYKSTPSIAT